MENKKQNITKKTWVLFSISYVSLRLYLLCRRFLSIWNRHCCQYTNPPSCKKKIFFRVPIVVPSVPTQRPREGVLVRTSFVSFVLRLYDYWYCYYLYCFRLKLFEDPPYFCQDSPMSDPFFYYLLATFFHPTSLRNGRREQREKTSVHFSIDKVMVQPSFLSCITTVVSQLWFLSFREEPTPQLLLSVSEETWRTHKGEGFRREVWGSWSLSQ